MKSNKTVISTTVSAIITEDNRLVISLPLTTPTLTKNQKNYVVAGTGTWPQNWITVDVDGEQVGLTVCALVKNMEHPDNKPQPVVIAPPVPTFFKKAAKPSGAPSSNGKASRIMPGSCA